MLKVSEKSEFLVVPKRKEIFWGGVIWAWSNQFCVLSSLASEDTRNCFTPFHSLRFLFTKPCSCVKDYWTHTIAIEMTCTKIQVEDA